MENIREKIAEIITHTYKTPLEQADEILLLFGVSGRSEQLFCFHCKGKMVWNSLVEQTECEDCGCDLAK